MEESRRRWSWRCATGLHHWLRRTNPDGGRYLSCRDCGKDEDPAMRTSDVPGG